MIAQPQTALRHSALAATDPAKERHAAQHSLSRPARESNPAKESETATPNSARSRRPALTGLFQIFTCAHRNYFTHVMADALRNAGQGKPTLVVQFLKGGCHQGPDRPMQFGKMLDWVRCRLERCINAAPQTEEELVAVQELWQFTRGAIASGQYDAVVLDELSLAITYGLIAEAEVVDCLRSRPSHIEVTLTGQAVPPALLQMADQVTELRNVFKTVIPEPSHPPVRPTEDLTPRIQPIPPCPPSSSAPLMQLGLQISGIAAATPHHVAKPLTPDIQSSINLSESKPKSHSRAKASHQLQQIAIPGLE